MSDSQMSDDFSDDGSYDFDMDDSGATLLIICELQLTIVDIESDEDYGIDASKTKVNRKSYEVEAKNISGAEIRAIQESQASQVANLLARPSDQALVLLRHYRWNKERLIEKLMDNTDLVLQDSGIPAESTLIGSEVMNDFECPICCEDGELETFVLSCGHRYCKDCYERYLIEKIVEEGEVRKLSCPGDGCKLALSEAAVQALVEPQVFERYRRLLDRAYVDDHDNIKWCPAPNCENAVECGASLRQLKYVIPSVTCAAGHSFCFGCSLDEHQPCICSIVKIWLKKCEDDSETSNWISANTKECPKCSSTIEKNGGCNHMTCRKCKYEFCWVCMGVWSDHGQSWYNCNRFEEKDSTEARDNQAKSRASLERYLHYYNRFANHEQSARLDRELYMRTETKMAQLQSTSDMSWIEVQFLRTAVDTLSACRRTLKWTYAFAFYLKRTNATELFEDNQKDLEMAVEQLSGLCEQPIIEEQIAKMKQQVLDKTVYVASRREVFLTDTAAGLAENRWQFTIDTDPQGSK